VPLAEHLCRLIGCALLPATAACVSLRDAAAHPGRLESATYKRLNLALFVSTLLLAGLARAPLLVAPAAVFAAGLQLTSPAKLGAWPGRLLQLAGTEASGLVALFSSPAPNFAAGFYAALVASLLSAILLTVAAPAIVLNQLTVLPSVLQMSPATLRLLAATLIPSLAAAVALADAARRDRLGASTFRLLNWALGLAALASGGQHLRAALTVGPPAVVPFLAMAAISVPVAVGCFARVRK